MQSDPTSEEEAIDKILTRQNEFLIGICFGTVISAFFFMTFFKKKIYLLIVFFNSLQIIYEVAKIIIIFIEQQLKAGGFTIIGKIPQPFFVFGGLIDMTSLFLLVGVLPALLALKYKGQKFEITMAGTLVGCVMAGSFIMGTLIQTSVSPFYLEYDS